MGAVKKIGISAKWGLLDAKIEKGLKKTATKLLGEKKKNNSPLIIADKKGKVRRIPSSQL